MARRSNNVSYVAWVSHRQTASLKSRGEANLDHLSFTCLTFKGKQKFSVGHFRRSCRGFKKWVLTKKDNPNLSLITPSHIKR